ncbi:MAG: DUF5615 family PIN-like protein [Chloroflexota bacterium]
MRARGWLVDNNVPRGVTQLLRQRGHMAVEVREVLGAAASDPVIAAYARRRHLRVVTHDAGFATRCLVDRLPCLWLRTRQRDDRARLEPVLDELVAAFDAGVSHAVLTRTGTVKFGPGDMT